MLRDGVFDRRRQRLVDQMRENGIDDERVLAAIGSVHRHRFVDKAFRTRAYEDEALPIGMKQTISQPFTVAYQTMLLAPQAGSRILEVGTGSGYQAAVLCELGAHVFSIERHRPLLERTRGILAALGYRVTLKTGDGTLGWTSRAPFDGIVITAGASEAPETLLRQLRIEGDDDKPAGRLVAPVGDRQAQTMCLYRRLGEDLYEKTFEDEHGNAMVSSGSHQRLVEDRCERTAGRKFKFVPLIGQQGGLGL